MLRRHILKSLEEILEPTSTKEVLVYNHCTSCTNPVSWKECCDLLTEAKLKNPRNDTNDLKPKRLLMLKSPLMVSIMTLIRDVIPVLYADMCLQIKGQKPRYRELQKRAFKIRKIIEVLIQCPLFVKSTRAQALAKSLDEEDKIRFPCDPDNIDWKEHMAVLERGIQKFILKEKK